jgi:hypothetical protein
MSTLKVRLDQAEAAIKIKRPAPDTALQAEIRRAARAFAAGQSCPEDVTPEVWQLIVDTNERY